MTDGDGDWVDGTLSISVDDDTPVVMSNEVAYLDDDALAGGNAGGVGDQSPDTVNATGTLGHAFGADGAGSVSWLTGGAPTGFSYEASGSDLLVKQGATTVMTLTLDAATGAYSVVQNAAILHEAGSDENDQSFTVSYRVTDGDGDWVDGTLSISVDDDTPVVNAVTSVTYPNTDNPVPGASGIFDYSIGADNRTTFSSVDSDFLMFRLTGHVGVNSITNSSITWMSETTTDAVFRVEFDYQPNEASTLTDHASGTLSFDKVAGTYSFALDQPIEGYSIQTTSSALAFTGYELNSTLIDKTQPLVSVAMLSDSLYAQFVGFAEPGGGTGTNNLQSVGVDSNVNQYVNGELFTQASSYVSISNVANGVAGDTIQKGEVLDFDLFTYNPQGFVNQPPDEFASTLFLKFDGINSEDLVVILKLKDEVTSEQTTKALIIDNSDILRIGNPMTADYRIVLDNNDGAVIIESNDFNAAGENYSIIGAQVLVSTEGINGTGINFNTATGAAGGSSASQSFGSATTDNDVIKISDIGIVTQSSTTPNADLHIDLAVLDADTDASATQTIDIYLTGQSTMSMMEQTV